MSSASTPLGPLKYEGIEPFLRVGVGKAYDPDPKLKEQVDDMIVRYLMNGVTLEGLKAYIGVTHATLRKYHAEAMDIGKALSGTIVAQNMFKMATADEHTNVTFNAAKFWLESREGWRATGANDDEGDATPVSVTFEVAEAKGEVRVTKAE